MTIIPSSLAFDDLSGLSNELKKKLNAARPSNLAQAAQVEGMTPAALALLHFEIKRLAPQGMRRRHKDNESYVVNSRIPCFT